MDEPPIGGIPPFVSAALMLWQLVSVSLPLECRAARHSNGKLTDTNCHSINAGLTNGGKHTGEFTGELSSLRQARACATPPPCPAARGGQGLTLAPAPGPRQARARSVGSLHL